MNKLTCCILLISAAVISGCSSNANQKIAAPLFGTVHNEYYVLNVSSESDLCAVTNVVKGFKFGSGISTNSAHSTTGRMSLGRGNDIIAVDNQILVGHDIGNATSNDVNASASIPLSF